MYIKTPWFVIASRREILRREIIFARNVAVNIRNEPAMENLDRAIARVKAELALPTNEEAVNIAEEIIKYGVL